MKVTIRLDPEVYNHIRALVHDELSEQKNRQKIEQLGMKIRAQLEQLAGPKRSASGLDAGMRAALKN